MFLLQIAQAPFVAHIADADGQPQYQVHIPKYTLQDAITWGAELTERWRASQVEGLSDLQQREFNAMNPLIPATLYDLKKAVNSLEGAKEVISQCLPRAKVFEVQRTSKAKPAKWSKGKEITSPKILENLLEQTLSGNSSGTLISLATELADLKDTSDMTPPPERSDEEGETDPLSTPEKRD